jgi:hypothetical protein
MSHLLEVLFLMITISILPSLCIKTIWQGDVTMQPGNNESGNNSGTGEFQMAGNTKHNKERFLYITKELWWILCTFVRCVAMEVINEDILSDLWYGKKEIFQFP